MGQTAQQRTQGILVRFLCGLLLIIIQAYGAPQGNLSLSEDSHIGFKATKFGFISVDGIFKDFSGNLSLDAAHNITALSGEVKIISVFTDSKKRDAHLLESDFLDAKAYPTSRFVMTKYEVLEGAQSNKARGKVYGNLTLHGVTLPLVFDSLLVIESNTTLELKGELNIKDFGMQGSKMNSDKIELHIKTLWK
ncbi:YceI family protein [Helicobacter sp. MIT 21-1697]|uniref:YceI family protein n=1 Tax=Helicobacter sp. MIT 21-1697 TaxID=2993733 RepID=UPI00224AC94F|nr:YceI family protein [Helicobacter sp. MIT 21-1697]MCX2717057.1 YceI family protein [Helicobacter sp. MIT 21-1697]